MSVVVVAVITPEPGKEDAVREAILETIPKVHAEPGCELYALHEGAGEFVMVERWASPEALAGKVTSAPQVRRLQAVPAGDAERGAL